MSINHQVQNVNSIYAWDQHFCQTRQKLPNSWLIELFVLVSRVYCPVASCAVKMDMWGGPNGLLSSEERSLFPQLVIIMLWYLPHIACTACPRRRVPHRKRIKTVAPWQLVDIYCAWVPEQTAFAMQCCNSEVHTHFTPIFSHFLSQNSRSERKPQILNT